MDSIQSPTSDDPEAEVIGQESPEVIAQDQSCTEQGQNVDSLEENTKEEDTNQANENGKLNNKENNNYQGITSLPAKKII